MNWKSIAIGTVGTLFFASAIVSSFGAPSAAASVPSAPASVPVFAPAARTASHSAQLAQPPTALFLPLPGVNGARWLVLDADHKPANDPVIRDLTGYRVVRDTGLVSAAQASNGRWGYLDAKGQWLVAPQYDMARAFAPDGLARIQLGGKWGYLGPDLKVRIAPQFDEAEGFSNGMAAIRKGKLWGYVDTSGTVVVPPSYELAGRFAKNGLARVRKHDKDLGFIDRTGKLIIRASYDYALDFGVDDVTPAHVKDGDDVLTGLIDASGNWVLKPKYNSIESFDGQQLAAVRKTWSQIGYINTQGKEVIAPREGLSVYLRANRVRLGSDGSSNYSFLDGQGKPAFPGKFEWVGSFSEAAQPIPARRAGQWGLLSVDGQWTAAGQGREPLLRNDRIDRSAQPAGLTSWLNPDKAVEWLDAKGQVVYRLEPVARTGSANHAARLTHLGTTVWQSGPLPDALYLRPFFEPQVEQTLSVPLAQVGALARKLLAASPRKFLPYSEIYGERRDPYDLSGEDQDTVDEAMWGAMHVLASTYVDEETWGSYYFLEDQRDKLFKDIGKQVCQALAAELGPALTRPSASAPENSDQSDNLCVWQVGSLRVALKHHYDTGDGDFEHQINLVVQAPKPNRKPAK